MILAHHLPGPPKRLMKLSAVISQTKSVFSSMDLCQSFQAALVLCLVLFGPVIECDVLDDLYWKFVHGIWIYLLPLIDGGCADRCHLTGSEASDHEDVAPMKASTLLARSLPRGCIVTGRVIEISLVEDCHPLAGTMRLLRKDSRGPFSLRRLIAPVGPMMAKSLEEVAH